MIHTRVHAHTHTYMHACTQARTHTHTHTHSSTHARARTHTHTRARARACIRLAAVSQLVFHFGRYGQRYKKGWCPLNHRYYYTTSSLRPDVDHVSAAVHLQLLTALDNITRRFHCLDLPPPPPPNPTQSPHPFPSPSTLLRTICVARGIFCRRA